MIIVLGDICQLIIETYVSIINEKTCLVKITNSNTFMIDLKTEELFIKMDQN